MFEILVNIGIHPGALILTNDGRLIHTDFRVWHAEMFRVFAPDDFPRVISHQPLCGAGASVEDRATPFASFAASGITEITMHRETLEIATSAGWNPLQIWSPRFVAKVTDTWTRLSHALIREGKGGFDFVIGTLSEGNHWIAFHISWGTCGLDCTFFDGLRPEISQDLLLFAEQVALATGVKLHRVRLQCQVRQTFGHHCGAIALMHLQILAGHQGPHTEDIAVAWHSELIDDLTYLIQLEDSERWSSDSSPTLEWLLTGSGPGQEQELAKLL